MEQQSIDECDLRQQIENKKRNKSNLKQHRTISLVDPAGGGSNSGEKQQQRNIKWQQKLQTSMENSSYEQDEQDDENINDEYNESDNEMMEEQQQQPRIPPLKLKRNQLMMTHQHSAVTESDTDDAFHYDEDSTKDEDDEDEEMQAINDVDNDDDDDDNVDAADTIENQDNAKNNKKPKFITGNKTKESNKYSKCKYFSLRFIVFYLLYFVLGFGVDLG